MRHHTRLNPLFTHSLRTLLHGRGWPRTMALRRVIAVSLVLLAVALALRPAAARGAADSPVLVAGGDLPPGHALTAADLVLHRFPTDTVPGGALTTVAAGVGHVLSSGVRAGEPLTDVRLLGPADTALTTGDPSVSSVPIRLADPDVAELLRPGTRVDVVTLDPERQSDPVLAEDATVLTVRDENTDQRGGGLSGSSQAGPNEHGRLVVIALPRGPATQVAAASLRQPVTVTLR